MTEKKVDVIISLLVDCLGGSRFFVLESPASNCRAPGLQAQIFTYSS